MTAEERTEVEADLRQLDRDLEELLNRGAVVSGARREEAVAAHHQERERLERLLA